MPSLLDTLEWPLQTARVVARLTNRLRVARSERGLSQSELAAMAGVTRQTISSIETGQYCPSALLAFVIAKRLGARVDALFTLEGDEP